MTKELIDVAPEGIKKNYITRLYGSRSLAESYINAAEYAWTCHFDVPRYVPIFGRMADQLKAAGDFFTYRAFCNAHAHELLAEREAERRWLGRREFVKGPSAAEVTAKNQAAAAADRLEIEITQRAAQIMHARALAAEAQAREQAMADARAQLGARR